MSNIDLNQIFITNNTQGIGDTVVISSGYPATNSVGPSRFSLTSLGGVLSGPLLIDDGPSTHFRVVLNELQRKYFKRRKHASRNGSTVVSIFIPPPSFKPVSLYFSRSPLSKTPKTPKQVFFNPINIFATFTQLYYCFIIYFFI